MTASDDLWAGFDPLTAEDIAGPVWDEPVPLTACQDLPAFPVDALPPWLRDMTAAIAEETQTPVDLAGCLALAVLATTAGGRVTVRIRGQWCEPLNLYTVCALDPGNRKSAVFSLMTGPLLAAEKALVDLSGPLRAEAETKLRLAEKAAEKAAQKAAAADPEQREALTADAVHLAQEAEELTVPHIPQLVADDITPENLATALEQQGGRISLMSPEGDIFDIMAGRYSSKPNLGMFLKGHAGDMIRVNRQGREAQCVDRPAVTMGIAVQPDVLDAIGRVEGADGRGLLARFLYSKPQSLVGHRNLTPDLIPEHVTAAYARHLGSLALALAARTEPAELALTPDADKTLLAYQEVTETGLGKGGALAPITKWASKRDGAVARIAGLLHLATHLDDGWQRPVDAPVMDAATRLGDYFTAHALDVFGAMSADPAHSPARTVYQYLKDTRLTGFNARKLYRALPRSDFPAMADLDPALLLLEEHGWIRQQPQPPRTSRGGRPPKPRYDTHPRLLAGPDA
ncbi:YfjI family protein [Streptomyces sp. NPDC057654]|uniref:YfjI family protein n=1 Tax=Streptomyces sp. NPDC057654 TaxID=3346196 RepID=UPI0036927048